MKTSVYLPDVLAAEAKRMNINVSALLQRTLIEAVTWARTGPPHSIPVEGMTVAQMIAEMDKAGIPLSATITADDTNGGEPLAVLRWEGEDV